MSVYAYFSLFFKNQLGSSLDCGAQAWALGTLGFKVKVEREAQQSWAIQLKLKANKAIPFSLGDTTV